MYFYNTIMHHRPDIAVEILQNVETCTKTYQFREGNTADTSLEFSFSNHM